MRPDFADAIDEYLGPLPDLWLVVQGLRTLAQQAALYAQGRTAPGPKVTDAEPGSSAHNYGLAVDVALEGKNGQPTWDLSDLAWQRLWDAIRASPVLHSGQDFPKGETDPDHVERFNWREHLTPSDPQIAAPAVPEPGP